MAKKTSLAAALQEAAGNVPPTVEPIAQPMEAAPQSIVVVEKSSMPPSRQGKKAITGYFDPAVSRQLKQIMLDQDSTMQALLAEALNDLFQKHGKKPIA
jgi:hypothetical protein